MEYLLVIIAAPIAVWLLDRVLYRGEFAEAVREAVRGPRTTAKKPARTTRL